LPVGAPTGNYWDGGVGDYQLHWPWARAFEGPGIVLYPHYEARLVPGWLDKRLFARHAATPALANVVLLAPSDEWLRALPGGRLPDRGDYRRLRSSPGKRQSAWAEAVARSEALAEDFAGWLARGCPVDETEPWEGTQAPAR